jgi:glutamate synthase (NADPH/NADH) small chain
MRQRDMGDPRGFLKLRRATPAREAVESRVQHWAEFYTQMPERELREQGARCMDCGVPFCQGDTGCPIQNVIPDWNDLVYEGKWREAFDTLHATNNFPELTGRLCPAPCESACVLTLIDQPVAIRTIEQAIADRGFAENWVTPESPRYETGRHVAVIGSGPAGLAAAQQLRRLGHGVVVFEKADRVGGLLRYGVPDFKLEKNVLDRRLAQLAGEGIVFRTGVNVGHDVAVDELRQEFDAICLAVGAEAPRTLDVPGRELHGIHLAMDYLAQQNRRVAGDVIGEQTLIDARGKRVVIIGGGDTGADCAGTAIRQGARSVRQFVLIAQPSPSQDPATPWPLWPMQLRTSHVHEEGCEREWSVSTTGFSGKNGRVERLHAIRVETRTIADGPSRVVPIPGTELSLRAELVLLAIGFSGPVQSTLLGNLGVKRNADGLVATDEAHRTNVPGVFAAGDMRRGASLVVWAIREGRDAARSIDEELRVSYAR